MTPRFVAPSSCADRGHLSGTAVRRRRKVAAPSAASLRTSARLASVGQLRPGVGAGSIADTVASSKPSGTNGFVDRITHPQVQPRERAAGEHPCPITVHVEREVTLGEQLVVETGSGSGFSNPCLISAAPTECAGGSADQQRRRSACRPSGAEHGHCPVPGSSRSWCSWTRARTSSKPGGASLP